MRTVNELLDRDDPAWPQLQQWMNDSPRPVEVLPRDAARADAELVALQITTHTSLGSVVYETGGIRLDHGWLHLLGSGGEKMKGSIASWNGLAGHTHVADTSGMLLVAYDALGGFFALDGGRLGKNPGEAYYFAPDALEWEGLDRGYTELVHFLITGDVEGFYGEQRWPGWEEEVQRLAPDEGLSLSPPLYSAEGKDVSRVSRKPIPMIELLRVELEVAKQLRD